MWQLLTKDEEETWNDQQKSFHGSSIKGRAKVGGGIYRDGPRQHHIHPPCDVRASCQDIDNKFTQLWGLDRFYLFIFLFGFPPSPLPYTFWSLGHPSFTTTLTHYMVCLPDGRFFTHINQRWYLWRDRRTDTATSSDSYGSCYAVVLVVIWWMIRPSSPEPHKYGAIHIYTWTEHSPCSVKYHHLPTASLPQKLLIRYSDLIPYPLVHFLSLLLLYVGKCQFIGKIYKGMCGFLWSSDVGKIGKDTLGCENFT